MQEKIQAYVNNLSDIPFFQSYFSDKSQYVCASGKLSVVGTMEVSILGPLLFCIITNNQPLHIRDKKVGSSLSSDDSSFYTSGKMLKERNASEKYQ